MANCTELEKEAVVILCKIMVVQFIVTAVVLCQFKLIRDLGIRQLSRYSNSLRVGRSGDRIPVGGEIFRSRPDRPWGQPSLLYNGYRVFTGGKAAGAWC